MASPDVDVSVGYSLTITGGSTNNTWAAGLKIFDVTPPADEGEDVQTSSQGMTEKHHTYLPADIGENTELTMVVYHKQDSLPVTRFVEADGETLEVAVLTYPDGETATFDTYVKSYSPDTHAFNERMMATAILKVSGDIT